MNIFEGECFDRILRGPYFEITAPGPLHHPINKFKIYRDNELQIVLETESDFDSAAQRDEFLAGTVRLNTSTLALEGINGNRALISGVQVQNSNQHLDVNSIKTSYRIERSRVSSLEISIGNKTPAYLVEWLDNFDAGFFIYPDLIDEKVITSHQTQFKTADSVFDVLSNSESSYESFNCVKSSVDNIDFFLVVSHKRHNNNIANGYILYTSQPSKGTRKKIRDAISFTLGRPLIYLGYTVFDIEWKVVSTEALSPHTFKNNAYSFQSTPPMPLSPRSRNEIEKTYFSKIVNSIYEKYDALNFEYFIWHYWYACIADVSMAPAHWGALHESLMHSIMSNYGSKFKSRIIEDEHEWRSIKAKIVNSIDELTIDPSLKELLLNKINVFNQLSHTEKNKQFLNFLKLEFSDFEMKVWKRRNHAAHGRYAKQNEVVELIRDSKVLRILLNRMIIKFTEASENYYDYYSLDFPIRPINQPIHFQKQIDQL